MSVYDDLKEGSKMSSTNPDIKNRDRLIIRTGVIGILINILLAAFKAVAGILSHSIAMMLDAVNNISDALSSVVTIIGIKLAGKAPDKKHPFGHGRAEYLSALIVSAIVIYAGGTALTESVKKIINPEKPDYPPVALVIMAVAIAAKLLLGRFVKKQGEKLNSGALAASGADALFDAVLSASVLASAFIFIFTGLSLEAYVGVLISVVIIKAGIEMISETLNDILGQRADSEITKEIKRLISEEPEVRGAYDLIINNYGPNKNLASVHIELPDTMTVDKVDELTRRLEKKIYTKTGVVLTGVGVYSYNTGDGREAHIRNEIQKIVLSHEWALQLHGFYINIAEKTMRFDVVLSFDIDHAEGIEVIKREVKEAYPEYEILVVPDADMSD